MGSVTLDVIPGNRSGGEKGRERFQLVATGARRRSSGGHRHPHPRYQGLPAHCLPLGCRQVHLPKRGHAGRGPRDELGPRQAPFTRVPMTCLPASGRARWSGPASGKVSHGANSLRLLSSVLTTPPRRWRPSASSRAGRRPAVRAVGHLPPFLSPALPSAPPAPALPRSPFLHLLAGEPGVRGRSHLCKSHTEASEPLCAPPGCRPRVSATETACVPHRLAAGEELAQVSRSPFHPGRVTPWRAPSAGQATLNAAREHWIRKRGSYSGSLTKSYVLAKKRECRGGRCSSYHSEGPRAELRPRSAGQRRQGGGLTSSLPQSGAEQRPASRCGAWSR